ncbi:hypothetical protein HanXRQr2_Chr07g0294231 [Helianthus annuus]|uniref:Uncharacterized protein n=1 Tax=Helianthus annuus TaxID=4232 RepID=A0A9K3IKB3_HELAN|nr:hypothetical protein HanXRQr2_Chr07g0294231 [Helianthus annuus]KAJ0904660.1 hypothetical protein HanPSC8_Chr07g0284871 [Helianthus annuus]
MKLYCFDCNLNLQHDDSALVDCYCCCNIYLRQTACDASPALRYRYGYYWCAHGLDL